MAAWRRGVVVIAEAAGILAVSASKRCSAGGNGCSLGATRGADRWPVKGMPCGAGARDSIVPLLSPFFAMRDALPVLADIMP